MYLTTTTFKQETHEAIASLEERFLKIKENKSVSKAEQEGRMKELKEKAV